MGNKTIWTGACAALIVSLMGTMFVGNGKLSALQQKEQKNEAVITELSSKLEDLKSKAELPPPVTLSDEEQTAVTQSASELGTKVAEYQNKYAGLSASRDRETFSANVGALDACFTEESKAARVPWYSGKRPGVWEFVTDGAFKGDTKEVLWLCRDKDDGSLLAYATGVYESKTKLFGEVSYEMSVLGNASVESSGTGPASSDIDTKQVQDMADSIKEAGDDSERELSEGETVDVKEGQELLREKLAEQEGSDE